MTNTFLLVILLLEVRVLHSFVLPIKLCFTIKRALVLELVGLEVLLLYQIARECVSFALAFSSTSRVPMRSTKEEA